MTSTSAPSFLSQNATVPASKKQDGGAFTSAAVDWAACFVSLLGLLLNLRFGAAAIGVFIAPWGFLAFKHRRTAFPALVADFPILLLPLLAIFSPLWSDYPDWSLRAGIQYLLTSMIGIWLARCVGYRTALSAFLLALMILAVAGAAVGTRVAVGLTGEVALVGLFSSKNAFSFSISLMTVLSVAVWLDRGFPKSVRIGAATATVAAPFLLIAGKSLGAILVSNTVICLMIAVSWLLRRSQRVRFLLLWFAFVFVALAMMAWIAAGADFGAILEGLGKDPSLTGRTYLWLRALDFFSERPMLGVGYQAFWRQGNPGAEELWYYSHIESRSGFHFHDTYLQIMVDLGIVGLLCLLVVLIPLFVRAIRAYFGASRAESVFLIGALEFLLMRSPVEIDLFFQFGPGTILLCLVWACAKPWPATLREDRR